MVFDIKYAECRFVNYVLTTNVLIASCQWYQIESLRQACTRSNRASLTTLKRSHVAAELRVDHGNFYVLHDHAANVANRFPGVVGNNDVGSNLFSMVVDFPVQSHFEGNLSITEGESFANERARETTSTRGRCMLQLSIKKTNILYPP